MSVEDIIEDKLARHITAGNRDPENLYLGHHEHAELIKECCGQAGWDLEGIKHPRFNETLRLEWMGLKVFKVDSNYHVGFS